MDMSYKDPSAPSELIPAADNCLAQEHIPFSVPTANDLSRGGIKA